jgi:hypothetical protein
MKVWGMRPAMMRMMRSGPDGCLQKIGSRQFDCSATFGNVK